MAGTVVTQRRIGMAKLKYLTDRQNEIYAFIVKRIRRDGYSPTIREIGSEFGIRSPNGTMSTLEALEKKGMITRESKVSRGIRLVGGLKGKGKCPLCGGRLEK